MRESLIAVAERRARLVARARTERELLAAQLQPADGAALAVRSALRVARRALERSRQHPLFMTALVALLVALRPRRALTWLARGWSLWRLYRGAQRWLRQYVGRTPDAA
jgi:hypothetical protein